MTLRLSPLSSAAAACLQPAQPCPLGVPASLRNPWLLEDMQHLRNRTERRLPGV